MKCESSTTPKFSTKKIVILSFTSLDPQQVYDNKGRSNFCEVEEVESQTKEVVDNRESEMC